MTEVIARVKAEELAAWEEQVRLVESQQPRTRSFNPLQPASAVESEFEDAIDLVRRGVRVAPFAESRSIARLLAASNEPIPAEIQVQRDEKYDFFLVQLTFTLVLDDGEEPDSAEFLVTIEDGVNGPRATRATEVFPQGAHSTWFKAEAGFSVGLDASAKFALTTPPVGGPEAGVSGSAGANAKVIAGPYPIEIGRTEIEVSGEGSREIGWRYLVKRTLKKKNDFRSFLVLKVADETPRLQLNATLGVKTYRKSWRSAWLRQNLPIQYANKQLVVELPGRQPQ